LSEHYSLADRGPIAVRLTLHRSGLIRSTVSFESAKDAVSLSWLVLGNGLISPASPPLGLIGASATSSLQSSKLDIAAVQRGLASSSSERVDLSVTMVPTCFNPSLDGPPEDELQTARVDQIKLRPSLNKRSLSVQLKGAGSGKVPIRAMINGRWCSQIGWGTMTNGGGAFKLSVPPSAVKLSLYSSQSSAGIQLRNARSSKRRDKPSRMCAQLLQEVK